MSKYNLEFCRNCGNQLNEKTPTDINYCKICVVVNNSSIPSFQSILERNLILRINSSKREDWTHGERILILSSNVELANLYRDYVFPFITCHQYKLNSLHAVRLYLELALNTDTLPDLTEMDIYLYGCKHDAIEPDKELPYWNWINHITVIINCDVNEAVEAIQELLRVGLLEIVIRKGFTYFCLVPQTIDKGLYYSPDRIRENRDNENITRG